MAYRDQTSMLCLKVREDLEEKRMQRVYSTIFSHPAEARGVISHDVEVGADGCKTGGDV